MKWTLMFFIAVFLMLFMMMSYLNNSLIFEYNFSSINNLDFKLYLMFDWMSCFFSWIFLLISSMVLLYSHSYMNHDKNSISFCWMVLLFVLSTILLIMMPNAFMFILGASLHTQCSLSSSFYFPFPLPLFSVANRTFVWLTSLPFLSSLSLSLSL